MATIRLLTARLRTDQLPALLIVVLVAATALVAGAAPRVFNRLADEGLRYQVREATVVERNLQLGRITGPDNDEGDGMGPVARPSDEIEAGLPDSVRGLISGKSALAKSIGYAILDRPPERPGFLTMQFQDGLDQQIRLVDGRLPTGKTERVPAPDLPPASEPIPEDLEALAFEVAISTTTADSLGTQIGDTLVMVPDTDDPLVGAFGFMEPVEVRVVGLYEVVDPAGDFWVGDRGLSEPFRVPVGIDTVLIYATGLMSPDAYPAMRQLSYPMRYAFRFTIDAERLDAGMLDGLVTDLQRMDATYASFATQFSSDTTTLQSGLLDLTARYRSERRATEAVLTTAAIGPAAVALAALGVLALLAVRRRRSALILLRGRGGSAPQIVGSHLVEGLILAVAPAAAAVLVATRLVDARPTPATSLAAGLVALGAIVVLAAAVLPSAVAPLRRLGRETPAAIGASPRRLAFEGLAVGLAIGGVLLLRQRGLAGGSTAGQLTGVDPFLAAVPALVGLAVAIVTLRLYPYPIRALGWMAAAGPSLVPTLGLRRAERQAGIGQLPLVVLLLTVAIGTFSSTMLATIDRGQISASWLAVGAAHRITATEPLRGFDPASLTSVPGVEAVAVAHETEATVGLAGGAQVRLIALDAPEFVAVTAGTPAATRLPEAFIDPAPSEERPGTTTNPIPAIVARQLARRSTTSLRVGDTFQLTIAARFATFRVVELRDAMAGQGSARDFIVVPREALTAGLIDRPLDPTTIFIRAPADARAGIEAAVAASGEHAQVDSQGPRIAELRERPLVDAVRLGFTLALLLALAYAALAVVVALVLSGMARAAETANLRTLGIGSGQVTLLAVVEHAPPVLVAIVAGLILGIGVAWVVLPGLGLGAFTGAASDPALAIDLGQLLALTAALIVIVAVGVTLASWAQRRANPALAIRSAAE